MTLSILSEIVSKISREYFLTFKRSLSFIRLKKSFRRIGMFERISYPCFLYLILDLHL